VTEVWCKIDKLCYRVPTNNTLKDGLRLLRDNFAVIDFIYHHLYCEIIDLIDIYGDDDRQMLRLGGNSKQMEGLDNVNVERVAYAASNVVVYVVGNTDDDGSRIEVGNEDLDHPAANLVDVEYVSNNYNLEKIEARRKVKEYSTRGSTLG